jgi:hypothetical protein
MVHYLIELGVANILHLTLVVIATMNTLLGCDRVWLCKSLQTLLAWLNLQP